MNRVKHYQARSIAGLMLCLPCWLILAGCEQATVEEESFQTANLSTPEAALETMIGMLQSNRCARVHTICTATGRISMAQTCALRHDLQGGEFRATESYHQFGADLASPAVVKELLTEDRVRFHIPRDVPVCVEFVQVSGEWRVDYCDWDALL